MRKSWHSISEYQALRAMMEGNTTASAARRLGLSQSAISRSLSNLESRVGTTLFDRDSGRLSPTSAAVRLNARLDALFQALDDIDAPRETTGKILRLIAPPTFANQFIVAHMASFMQNWPGTVINLEIGKSSDVVSGIQNNNYDLGIVGIEPTQAGTKLIPFRKSSAACIMPSDHRLAALDLIRPKDLHGENLIAFNYRHARRAQLDKLMLEVGAEASVVCEVSSSSAAIGLVQLGVGITVANPFPSAQYPLKNVVFRPFISPITYQTYFVAPDQRPLSQTARNFLRHVRLHTPKDSFSETV